METAKNREERIKQSHNTSSPTTVDDDDDDGICEELEL
jgi:glutaredoxin